MSKLLVTIGGSHRKYNKQIAAFRNAGIEINPSGSASLGSKLQHAIIPDTDKARELLKVIGGSVARRQWDWLKDSD